MGGGGVYPFVNSSVPVNFTLPLVGVYPFVSSVPVSLTLLLFFFFFGGGGGSTRFVSFVRANATLSLVGRGGGEGVATL